MNAVVLPLEVVPACGRRLELMIFRVLPNPTQSVILQLLPKLPGSCGRVWPLGTGASPEQPCPPRAVSRAPRPGCCSGWDGEAEAPLERIRDLLLALSTGQAQEEAPQPWKPGPGQAALGVRCQNSPRLEMSLLLVSGN